MAAAAAAKRTTGAEEWWQTLSERDAFQHSQNSASGSTRPPCQNRVPAKDDRKTLWVRPCAGASDANNLSTQCRVLVDCEQVFENVGSGASWNRAGVERVKATGKHLSWRKGVAGSRPMRYRASACATDFPGAASSR